MVKLQEVPHTVSLKGRMEKVDIAEEKLNEVIEELTVLLSSSRQECKMQSQMCRALHAVVFMRLLALHTQQHMGSLKRVVDVDIVRDTYKDQLENLLASVMVPRIEDRVKNVKCSNVNIFSSEWVLYVKDFATGRSIDIDKPENELGYPLAFKADRVRKAYRIFLLERYEIKIRAGWLEMQIVLQNEVSQLVSHTEDSAWLKLRYRCYQEVK